MKSKKFLSLLLAVTMVLAMIPAFTLPTMAVDVQNQIDIPDTANEYTIGDVTYVVIRSVEALNEALAADTDRVNSYILDADLDYTGKTFKRIVLHQGIFDGNGHKMFGYELVDQDNGEGAGTGISTFAGLKNDSNIIIRNVTLGTPEQHISVSSTFSGSSIGAVLAYSNCTHTIENVTVYADITSVNVNVGGFAGNVVGQLTMKNCKFYGSINATTGGVVGSMIGKANALNFVAEDCENYAPLQATQAGGIIGGAYGASGVNLKNCVNHETVQSNNSYAAGMIATIQGTTTVSMENCVNYGAVSNAKQAGGMAGNVVPTGSVSLTKCVNYGDIAGTQYLGGMLGAVVGNISTTITACENYGNISYSATPTSSSVAYFGGIIGWLKNTVSGLEIKNTVNYGDVSGLINVDKGRSGGVIGFLEAITSLTVENCLSAGSITGCHVGGIVGYFANRETNVTNFANIGAINGKFAGGLIGSTVAGSGTITLTNCGSFAEITTTSRGSSMVANQTGANLTVSGLVGVDDETIPKVSIQKETKTLTEGLAWVREKFPAINFALNDATTAIVVVGSDETAAVAEAKFLQYQKDADSMDIRVLGVLNDSNLEKYENLGFVLTVKRGTEVILENNVTTTTTVYSSILANEAHGITEYTAKDLGASYLYAMEIHNLPLTGTFTLEIRAFSTEVGGEPAYDNLVTVTVVDGQLK